MKITFKRTAVFLSAAILLIIGIGCSKSTVSTNTQPNIADGGTAPKATPTTTVAKAIDIAGNYAATGTNVGGGGNYMADLTITKRDDVYQFSWQSGPNKYDGVGVRTGDSVAVAFTEGQDGKGCGVVLYKIEDDGSLNGKAGYWGVNTAETETAKRAGATAFEGKYDVTGKNSAGGDYTGKLDIKQSGEGYDFVWDAG